MGGKTRRKRGKKSHTRRKLSGGGCPFAAAPSPLTGGKRTRRKRAKKHRGGLSSQLIPWALLAGVLGSAKKHRKSKKSKRRGRK